MFVPLATGSSIRIFLLDGRPQGPRIVDRPGWTGSCLAFSRSDYGVVRERAELARTGVYVLTGSDADGDYARRIYIGEADVVRKRLDAHQSQKDFWTEGFVLTSSDLSLNKAHVRYLEARLIAIATAADAASFDNQTSPEPAHLDEPGVADMERFLAQCLPLFSLLGVDAFEPVTETPVSNEADGTQGGPATEGGALLRLDAGGAHASGIDSSRGFIVHSGAQARRHAVEMVSSYNRLRQKLIDEEILVPDGEMFLRLTKDYIFGSPSAAASVLIGGSRNGRTDWKDTSGRTLRELQEATIATHTCDET